ncbi:uncharacterized protein LOC120338385 [Styela clava]
MKSSQTCHSPFVYRLNLYCVYIIILVSIVMIANQCNLLSSFTYKQRKNSFRNILNVRFHSESNSKLETKEDVNVRVVEEFQNFNGDYQDMVIVEVDEASDENSTGFEYVTDQPLVTTFGNISFEDYQTWQEYLKTKSEYSDESSSKLDKFMPTILFWNPKQFPDSMIPKEPICGGGCNIVTDRGLYNVSDAILFTMKEYNLTDLPNKSWRHPNQAYVWWSEESTWTSKIMYEKRLDQIEENYFNWTMTFKRTSDVNAMMIPYKARDFVRQRLYEYKKLHPTSTDTKVLPGDEFIPSGPKTAREISYYKSQASKLLQRKIKTAAWVATNCGYTAGAVLRRDLVTKLQFQGLQVDIYGGCGNEDVPKTLADFSEMLSEYKFYLAFENALHCRDYITEKFWYNALYAGVVPVIWGPLKIDVEAVAPPDSYIHAENFDSTEHLVDYLIQLSKDDELYMRYFTWWWKTPGYFPIFGVTETKESIGNKGAMFDFEMNGLCHLCSLLNKGVHKKYKKSIPSLHKFWYTNETKTCISRTHNAKFEIFGSKKAKTPYKITVV